MYIYIYIQACRHVVCLGLVSKSDSLKSTAGAQSLLKTPRPTSHVDFALRMCVRACLPSLCNVLNHLVMCGLVQNLDWKRLACFSIYARKAEPETLITQFIIVYYRILQLALEYSLIQRSHPRPALLCCASFAPWTCSARSDASASAFSRLQYTHIHTKKSVAHTF